MQYKHAKQHTALFEKERKRRPGPALTAKRMQGVSPCALELLASLSAVAKPLAKATEPDKPESPLHAPAMRSPRQRDAMRVANKPRALPGRVLGLAPPTPVGPAQPLTMPDGGVLMAQVCMKNYEIVFFSA